MTPLGLFGKLPALGDFVSRGFSPTLREGLDFWLQGALSAATAAGATRESLEAAAQPLVVHIRPGVLAPTGFAGAVVPSNDRVGRFFPLCLGIETEAAMARQPLPWLPLKLGLTLCQLAIEAQIDRLTPEALWPRLAELPDPGDWLAQMLALQPFTSAGDITLPGIPDAMRQFLFRGPEAAMTALEQAQCSRLPRHAAILGGVITQPDGFDWYFASRDAQDPRPFAALLDGRWSHWGWPEPEASAAPNAAADDDDTLPPRGLQPPGLDDTLPPRRPGDAEDASLDTLPPPVS